MPPQIHRIGLWDGFEVDNPAQIAFLQSPAKYRLLSSGRGGGKSVVGCREALRIAHEFPGSRTMIARLKHSELEKSTHITLRREMRKCGFVKDRDYKYNDSKGVYYWVNGSEIVMSHLEDEEKFGSVELSAIFVDEGSQVPDSVYQMLFPANLRWDVGPHRAWFCTNPGPFQWLRDIVYGKAEGSGRVMEYERADGTIEKVVDEYKWFPVKPGWNKHNPGGEAYDEDLLRQGKRYGPHWLAKYREGDWSSFEGQRFPDFDHDKHILTKPFKLQPHHEVIEGWDFGHVETFVAWIAFNPRGGEPVVVFDELQMQEVEEPSQVAQQVHAKRKHWGINPIALGDPAGAAASQFSSVSPIGAYGALGIHISPAKSAKSPTWRADLLNEFITGEFKQYDGTAWPGILFHGCPNLVHSVVNLRWDTTVNTKGEDPRERFIDKDKHGFDGLTYGLSGVPPPSMPPSAPPPRPGVNPSVSDVLKDLRPA